MLIQNCSATRPAKEGSHTTLTHRDYMQFQTEDLFRYSARNFSIAS
jgi:hypothetical protein